MPISPEMKPGLAAVGSATVAVLSQSSGIAAIFCHEAGHVVYNNCALYMLLYQQQRRGFYCCIIIAEEVGTGSKCHMTKRY